MGRNIDYAAGTCRYNFAICHCTKCHGVCRLDWVSLLINIVSCCFECCYILYFIRRTKQRRIYVVSTHKRPVPLKHFLYTGNSKQTDDQLFEIVGADKKFSVQGLVIFLHAQVLVLPSTVFVLYPYAFLLVTVMLWMPRKRKVTKELQALVQGRSTM